MKTKAISLCLLANIIFLASTCPADDGQRPNNYSEIKTLLDSYANADDLMDEQLIAARKNLHSKGEEAVPALLVLFKENSNDHYRSLIVSALQNNKGSKESSMVFLEKELQVLPEPWKDKYWIVKSIDLMTANDPMRARPLARKALNAEDDLVKSAAVKSLAIVGTSEDVEKLKSFISIRRPQFEKPEYDVLSTRASDAIQQISSRTASGKYSETVDDRIKQHELHDDSTLTSRNHATNQHSPTSETGTSWLKTLAAVVAVLLGCGGIIWLLRRPSNP